jgi:hypothetical protein
MGPEIQTAQQFLGHKQILFLCILLPDIDFSRQSHY